MSDLVSINFTDLETISKSCKNRGDLAEIFDEIKKDIKDLHFQFSFTGNILNGGSGNDTQKAFSELLDEIDHNIRGIDNNVNDFGKSIGKYLDHMDGILEVPNTAMNVTVDKGIEDRKGDVNDIEDDYLSIVSKLSNSIIYPQKSFIIPPSDKEEYEQRLLKAEAKYTTINSTVSDIYASISSFNEEMSNIKDELKQLEKFIDKDDFKPGRVKNFVGTVAIIGISVVYPPAGLAIVVVKSAKKEFHDGRTVTYSLAIGMGKGGLQYFGGKVTKFAGTKIKAVGKRGVSALSNTKLGKALSSSTSKITSKASTAKTNIANSTSKLKDKLHINSKTSRQTTEIKEPGKKEKRQLLDDKQKKEMWNEYKGELGNQISGKGIDYSESELNDILENNEQMQEFQREYKIWADNNSDLYTNEELNAQIDSLIDSMINGVIWGD